ncbi:MAG: DsbA family protein [Rhodospirillales bacterium]|nr:MAG: DsbA family protein [Rhodospirillales bacterium]
MRLARHSFTAAAVALAMAALSAPAAAQQPLDKAAVEKIVREYLMANPEIIVEAVNELEKRQTASRDAAARKALTERKAELLEDPGSPVGGNPKGDVTIVEFFDYHCGYCKRAKPTVTGVVDADTKIRIVYKELPILTPNSRVAATAALAAAKQGKYAELHIAMMEARGDLTKERILKMAADLKIDATRLEKEMADPAIAKQLERNQALAVALGVNGTPAFVIGDKIIPGAVEAEVLREAVAAARKG